MILIDLIDILLKALNFCQRLRLAIAQRRPEAKKRRTSQSKRRIWRSALFHQNQPPLKIDFLKIVFYSSRDASHAEILIFNGTHSHVSLPH
jgi:hypothetical protein